jgi:GNAT superfamily N-acetyltransferase
LPEHRKYQKSFASFLQKRRFFLPSADPSMTNPTTRIVVTVTFLRQETPPPPPTTGLPADTRLVKVKDPTVTLYRHLYETVGAPWVWWLRRTMTDAELAALLAAPGVSLHVLYRGDDILGFFELDARPITTVNLSYFGLVPGAIGQGLGMALLHAAIAAAWSHHPRAVTVNTCTADHPRALPNYLKAGFFVTRTSREIWDVPNRLGITIPEHLKV